MKFKSELIKFYIFIVVIPIIIITVLLSFYQYHTLIERRVEEAEARAELLSETIDSFVLEITSDLELIADLIDEKDEQHIQLLLGVMNEKYPYAEAFYYANTEGIIYLASHTLTESIDIHFRPYFNTVMSTGETTLFYAKDSPLNNYIPMITIATPVYLESGEIGGVLIGDVHPTSILNQRPSLNKETNYILRDDETNTNILDTDNGNPFIKTVSEPLERAPWTVSINVDTIPMREIISYTLIIFAVCVLVTHLLYFIMRYYYEKQSLEHERQMHTMKKLELVGTLAGTFAHEVRNPLTGIMGFITLLKEKHQTEDDQMYYSVIETELTRINNIVGEFLVLGKPIVVNKKNYDVREIIQEVYPIIESEGQQQGVLTKTELAQNPLPLFCAKDHLKQLILNLAKNGIQASQAGDKVTITANRDKNFIFIRITDTGSGIPEEVRETLFEPFVTTKDEGTGLGLIVCKQITEMYHGTIEVDSTPNQGTTFLLSFPVSKKLH